MKEVWKKCLITGKEFNSARGFLNHLRSLGMKSKEYYDKFHKKEDEGICYCGNPTKYHGFTYKKYCSDTCALKSEEHRKAVSERFINNPSALENFKKSRLDVDCNIDKRRKTIKEKAEKLGITEYQYYSDHSRKAAKNISPERRKEIILKSMKTKTENNTFGGRSYYKNYILFGETIKVQGYEDKVLDYLISEFLFNKGEILAGGKRVVPFVRYKDINGNEHLYFPDIFIPKSNLLIEVKSTFTYEQNKNNVHQKAKGCLDSGYSILLLVLNSNKIRKYGLDGYKNLLDWAISSRAPKPTWYGAGSTTIPNGSREQVDGSRNMIGLNEIMI